MTGSVFNVMDDWICWFPFILRSRCWHDCSTRSVSPAQEEYSKYVLLEGRALRKFSTVYTCTDCDFDLFLRRYSKEKGEILTFESAAAG